MGWLKQLFGLESRTGNREQSTETARTCIEVPASAERSATGSGASLHITWDMLKQLFPIRNLSQEELNTFAVDRFAEAFEAGTVLFHRDAESDAIVYLLEGTVQMDVGPESSYCVQAQTAKAHFPLCSRKHYSATATALTPVQLLKVSPKIMCRPLELDNTSRLAIDPYDGAIPESVRGSKLFQVFCQYYREEALTIPSLPEVAFNLRKALERSADLAEVVDIVQLDPAIAGKLVHVANSPLYLSANRIHNLRDAVLRLGMAATRNLVASYSLRQIFQCGDPYINDLLHSEWRKSIALSSLCYTLASENGSIDPEEALLAGLIADIGIVPFLYFAENFPREYWSPDDVAQALPWIRGPVGAFVLNRWEFPQALVEIPLLAEDWFHDCGAALSLSDIVILSRLHAYIGTPRMAELPAINSIPACSKLANGHLSPEHSLKVLHEAEDKIHQAMRFFEF